LTAAPADSPPSEMSKVIVPFVQKHCVACHGEKVKKADLTLHTYKDEVDVLKNRKHWVAVLQQVKGGDMPPSNKPRPEVAEIEAFTRAVDVIFERADKNAKLDPGRVTIRRLNRTEYNNTIRDLVGVDFSPAEDFPSDDIGHGFDNIGDVLTVSPVLLERYLAAAESIMDRAIAVEPPKPPIRALASRWLEPSQQEDIRWRPITKGILRNSYKLAMDGEYVFRFRAHTQVVEGKEVPQVAIKLNDKEVNTQKVDAPSKEKAVIYETKLTLEPGDYKVTVELLNGDKAQPILVEWFELRGPADTRPFTQRKLLACAADKPKREQTVEVLTRFVNKAYRRPATKDEIARLVKLVETAESKGAKWEGAISLAFQAVLVSPKFLFRVELDDRPESDDAVALDDYHLASRLSYFLWSTMPDDELFALAEKKQLRANLPAQVQRMLKDPRAKSLTDNFAMQWLQLQRLKAFAPDARAFPSFDEPLRGAMAKETELFFDSVIREDRSLLTLLDADYTFLNERLARHYGVIDTKGTRAGKKPTGPPIRGPQFVRVQLSDGERGGLLTQAGILTVTSNPTRTSPVKRGRWVLEQILGTPPPPPPPDVPELQETPKAVLSGSLRQRLEQHRADPKCANCHAKMDPLGFAFENYDAVGAFRTKDGEFAIDPSGTLPDGKTFKGPVELKGILKDKKELFCRCLVEKMLIYALGRGLEYYDKRTIDKIVTEVAKNDYKPSSLLTQIVTSDPFVMRRGKRDAK